MRILQKSNSKISSRRQIDLKGAQHDVLILPGNRYRMVLETSAINFELKSEDEQDALIETYQTVLNSLACPIQVIIKIREMDIDTYLADYNARLAGETNEVYKQQKIGQTKFIKSLVKSNKILTRQFYIVVPYDAKEKTDFEFVKEQLALNAAIIEKGLGKLGMRTRRLKSDELLNLFYSFYSPRLAKVQPLTDKTLHSLKESVL